MNSTAVDAKPVAPETGATGRGAGILGTPAGQAVLGLTLLGLALRFSTLGVQRFWSDEAITSGLTGMSFGGMVDAIQDIESSPPLYYVLAWVWAQAFGSGEFALRALSALFGAATVPVVYLVARQIASQRAALAVTALAAVSPALVWYSQEARAYALLVLLSAVSLLFFVRALRLGDRRAVGWWAASSALALLTHYYAVFLVAAEAIALLIWFAHRRIAALATAAVGVVAVGVAPLALHQRAQGNADWIDPIPLGTRIRDAGELFLVGPSGDRLRYTTAAIGAVVLIAAVLLIARTEPAERRRALLLAALSVVAMGAGLILAVAGADYVVGRNFLPLWLPLAIAIGVGLGAERAPRAGLVTAVALSALSLWVVLAVPFDRTLQREADTVAITGSTIDVHHNRIATRAALFPVGGGGEARAAVACPAGYGASSGGASWIAGDLRDVEIPSEPLGGDRHGWAATARNPSDGDEIVMILAFCVAPA